MPIASSFPDTGTAADAQTPWPSPELKTSDVNMEKIVSTTLHCAALHLAKKNGEPIDKEVVVQRVDRYGNVAVEFRIPLDEVHGRGRTLRLANFTGEWAPDYSTRLRAFFEGCGNKERQMIFIP